MSIYTGSANTSFSSFATRTSASTVDSTDAVPERMPNCNYYRNLWWDKGELSSKAEWDKVTLPYKLAVGVTLNEYERRVEEFNVHGCWEWTNGDVIIYELPSEPHEICIGAITEELMDAVRPVKGTNAQIYSLGSTRKEADESFRPKKPLVVSPHTSDGLDCPWPNIVVEVAYTESVEHVLEKVKNYWLKPNRAHDAIVVKIDPVPAGDRPICMKVWHYCVSDRVTRNLFPARDKFDFGLHPPLTMQPGAFLIDIQLDCLYHGLKSNIQIPRNILPNPIVLDFFYVKRAIAEMFEDRE
ncbi:hypothetical protein RhiirA1_455614 [Rhizophagus irregularis]|uniref:Uncharacterized protein n=1 Tax=Rhizophagus irregularis TaxID=588596 RepID=A0A2I1EDS2_9GLOM|nr:hypothetical protein RhiirA1_455614 [Rhizophagus irregularis]PKY20261.1 hypothetical protein RhiirB3_433521 [Rhizophagus irregularis]